MLVGSFALTQERRSSKTCDAAASELDWFCSHSERRCSKTCASTSRSRRGFCSHSEHRCSKTQATETSPRPRKVFCRSERSCSKTRKQAHSSQHAFCSHCRTSLLQNDVRQYPMRRCFALTQNVAAPKRRLRQDAGRRSFALTQNVAAPKLCLQWERPSCVLLSFRTSLLQNHEVRLDVVARFCSHSERGCSRTSLGGVLCASGFALTSKRRCSKT